MRGKEDFQQGAVADQVRVIFHADGFHMTGVLLAHLLVRWVLDLAPTVPRDDIKHPLQGSEDRLGAPETTATEYRLLCHAEAPVMYDCRARARLPGHLILCVNLPMVSTRESIGRAFWRRLR